FDKQRHLVEQLEEVMPVRRVLSELGQGFVDQPSMARRMFAHVLLAASRRSRRTPAQSVELMVTHDAQRLAGFAHVVDDMQCFPDPRATVDDIVKEYRHSRGMAPDIAQSLVPELVEQMIKSMGETVDVS